MGDDPAVECAPIYIGWPVVIGCYALQKDGSGHPVDGDLERTVGDVVRQDGGQLGDRQRVA